MANKPSTIGMDGEHVDCYVGDDKSARFVYIVHQHDPGTGEHDEDKCMLDFPDANAAKAAYLAHIPAEWFHSMTVLPVDEFIAKVKATRDNPQKITASERVTRELMPHEKHHNAIGHAERQDATEVAVRRILGGIKPHLIRDVARRAAALDPKSLNSLSLPFDKSLAAKIANSLSKAYRYGHSQVYAERYRATGKAKTENPIRMDERAATKAAMDTPGLLAETSISDLGNWAMSRAKGAHIDAWKNGVRDADLEDAILQDLLSSSTAPLDRIAMEASRGAVAGGRWAAFGEVQSEIGSFARAEVMDSNTCPECDEGDGTEWPDLESVDWTPGLDCSCGANCRGQLVAIWAEEGTVKLG